MSNYASKLSSYVEALRPIIYVPTFDFHAFDQELKQISDTAKIHEYNDGLGYVNFETKQPISNTNIEKYSLEDFLALFISMDSPNSYLVLKDIHRHLEEPKILSLLKTISLKNIHEEDYYVTVFIVATKLVIPIELEKLITVYDNPLPSKEKIVQIINSFAQDMGISIDLGFFNVDARKN